MIEFTRDGESIGVLGKFLPVHACDYSWLIATGWLVIWINDDTVIG